MKIYFAGSIRGGRDDKELYFSIIKLLQEYGQVLTEHIGDENLAQIGEIGFSDSEIFIRDMDWVRESDLIVAEVTQPSLGVGYEIGQAEAMGKRIICLCREQEGRRLSAMISGNNKLEVVRYEKKEDLDGIFLSKFKQ